jgi:hypothetical protein
MGSPDFSDAPDVLSKLLDEFSELSAHTVDMNYLRERLRDAVRARCSYEVTTLSAMQKMNLLMSTATSTSTLYTNPVSGYSLTKT